MAYLNHRLYSASCSAFLFFVQPVLGEDNFEVMQRPFAVCQGANIPRGVRHGCISNASIFNKTNGAVYYCSAHWEYTTQSAQYTLTNKGASCELRYRPATGSGPYNAGEMNDLSILPFGPQPNSSVETSTAYWITKANTLDVEVCFFSNLFKECIPATLTP